MLMANGIVPRPAPPFHNPVTPSAGGSRNNRDTFAEIQSLEVRTFQLTHGFIQLTEMSS